MKNSWIVLFAVFFSLNIAAQNNLAHTRISIITCGPGDDLYSLFGHTAIRVIDSTHNSDITYNWGGFTFDQPNFYLKFLRGNLLYYSSADKFSDFMYEYVDEHRSVYEQVLNLDSAAKLRLLNAINFNLSGDNRFYKYDFLLDNCTTRVKNMVFENNETATIKTPIIPDGTTARDLIDYYLERGGKPWTQLGIDILLGSRVDRTISNDEAMFLPEFFMKGLSNAENLSKPFVKKTAVILQTDARQNASWKFIPLVITSLVCVILFFIATLKSNWAKTTIKFFDAVLLYVTGLIGFLILFMWLATDHTVCQDNINIAWALPTNLIAAFCMFRKPAWLSTYFFIAAIITAVLLAAWFWLPQHLNVALIPVILLLLNRYVNFTAAYKQNYIHA